MTRREQRRLRRQQQQMARGQQQQQPGGQQDQPQPQPNGQPQSAQQPAGGNSARGPADKMSDVVKDIWGHLPETLRIMLTSGVLPAALIAVVLNLVVPHREEAHVPSH